MHKIEMLASAIAQSEGFFAPQNDLPKQNHNEGDLRATPGTLPKDSHGFVIFTSDKQGWMGLLVQLLMYAEKGMTLKEVIYTYAPPTGNDWGNNTALYLSETVRRTGIQPDTQLWDLFTFQSIP